jgi:hypothetical protein
LEYWLALYVCDGFEHAVHFVTVARSVPAIISRQHFVIAEAEVGVERRAG